MGELRELKLSLRDISFLDVISSKLFKSPSTFSGHYCEPLSDSISEFLEGEPSVISVDQYHMVLEGDHGKQIRFWVGNYPYSYGSVHGHVCKYPSWDVVLKLRRIHLRFRSDIINKFISENRV